MNKTELLSYLEYLLSESKRFNRAKDLRYETVVYLSNDFIRLKEMVAGSSYIDPSTKHTISAITFSAYESKKGMEKIENVCNLLSSLRGIGNLLAYLYKLYLNKIHDEHHSAVKDLSQFIENIEKIKKGLL